MLAMSPLAYMLQTVPPIPALPDKKDVKSSDSYDEEMKYNKPALNSHNNANQEMTEQEEIDCRPLEDISAPDIKTALKEAFTNPTFIFITLGFSVCGFHVAFLSTHFPAYLVSLICIFFLCKTQISNIKVMITINSKIMELIPLWLVRISFTIKILYPSNTPSSFYSLDNLYSWIRFNDWYYGHWLPLYNYETQVCLDGYLRFKSCSYSYSCIYSHVCHDSHSFFGLLWSK